MGRDEALRALARAKKQCDKAAVHSWEPVDAEQAVIMAFLAYENAIVTEAKEIRWEKIHAKKAELAKKLCGDGILRTDVSETLRELNDGRFIAGQERRARPVDSCSHWFCGTWLKACEQ